MTTEKKTAHNVEQEEQTQQTQTVTPTPASETPGVPANPDLDLSKLRLDQDFIATAGVKKLLTTVPIRKPGPQDLVRVHPHPDFRLDAALIDLKEENQVFILSPEMAKQLPGEFYSATIYVAINRQNVIFLWPVKLPSPDGRSNDWARSQRQAAEMAMRKWIRVRSNRSLGAYEIDEAAITHSDPEWPPYTLQQLINIGFADRLINSPDHAVVRRLRGLT